MELWRDNHMTEPIFLTKAEPLAGKNTTVDIALPSRAGAFVKIRPLTAEEVNRVNVRKLKGIKQEIGTRSRISVDMVDTNENEFAGKVLMVTLAMVGEPWTESDVKSLPGGDFAAIVKGIETASGLTKQKQADIEAFRKE
mgnify:FL=1